MRLLDLTFFAESVCCKQSIKWCDKRGEGGVMNLWVSLFVCNNSCQCKLTGVSEELLLSDLLEVGF
jgi:hypothetical protein